LPHLNIIEPLWSVLESRVRSKVPPPSSVKQVKDVLNDETVQTLYESIPRRMQAVLQANGDPTPY